MNENRSAENSPFRTRSTKDCPDMQSEIARALASEVIAINELEEALHALVQRLDPILQMPAPTKTQPATNDPPISSKLWCSMDTFTWRIQNVKQVIYDLLGRLEI
jgi:hypothetical protein